MIEEGSALHDLQKAVNEFLRETRPPGVLLTVAAIVWEDITLDEAGDPSFFVGYAVPTDDASPAAVLGLLRVAEQDVMNAVTAPPH